MHYSYYLRLTPTTILYDTYSMHFINMRLHKFNESIEIYNQYNYKTINDNNKSNIQCFIS
jgi:guanylate kinase